MRYLGVHTSILAVTRQTPFYLIFKRAKGVIRKRQVSAAPQDHPENKGGTRSENFSDQKYAPAENGNHDGSRDRVGFDLRVSRKTDFQLRVHRGLMHTRMVL
jgi:hypothetical protein